MAGIGVALEVVDVHQARLTLSPLTAIISGL
jgi:hypothetical protein